ncbi:MAG: AAA family ATPase [Desulfobacteraceae bacterium]|nr:AAA family ATPase [Desulfobacteraceae bacterium]
MQHLSYLKALGLIRHPFPVAPDDEVFYCSNHIEQVIAEIEHGIQARKGFMIISGDVGLGKTTLTRRILKNLEAKNVDTSLIIHTSLKDIDLLKEINRDFGMDAGPDCAETVEFGDHLKKLNDFLLARFRQGKNCAIIIDDAQNLNRSSLELVRMISNLEADRQKLVQILLVGQSELLIKLKSSQLRQLRSRIVISKSVKQLCMEELRSYILFKLNQAGNQGRINITLNGLKKLFRLTRGNFRQVNMLMDRCLYVICNFSKKQINNRVVRTAGFDLFPESYRAEKCKITMAAAMLGCMLTVFAAYPIYSFVSGSLSQKAPALVRYYKIDEQVADDISNQNDKIKLSNFVQNGNTMPLSQAAPDVQTFLKAYNLEQYGPDFKMALGNGTLGRLSNKIYRQSGYRLVQLPDLPEQVRSVYGALALAQNYSDHSRWLLFWKPSFELKNFYFNYQSKEILSLQKLLAYTQFYHHRLDGIVGIQLMKSLASYQEHNKLPVTGFPDATTVFLLCHGQGRRPA